MRVRITRPTAKGWWKIAGLAGVMGVAATGALAVRADRQRKSYTPDQVRSRLHERYTQAYARTDTTHPNDSGSAH
ncbi:hypothetical protein [Rhodococcus sp. NPDC058521]|uniref:hypothetical protein n=1 Tax=Rhodococcus sp. NPDC058521 TaxID=3346536 RepID=UPI00365711C2